MLLKQFPYESSQSKGLFQYAREESKIIPSQNSLYNSFHFDSPPSLTTETGGFCANNYFGGEPQGLIDGNKYSSWANENGNDPLFFVIRFPSDLRFRISKIIFETVCSPPNKLQILGSNDNVNFQKICSVNSPLTEYSKNYIDCESELFFTFFKIEQIGNNVDNQPRMHVSEIEFFGTLKQINKTCQIKRSSFNLIYFIFFLNLINNFLSPMILEDILDFM